MFVTQPAIVRLPLLSDISIEIGLGLETPRGALVRLGDANVDDKLAEIEEYKLKKQEEQVALFQQTSADGQDTQTLQDKKDDKKTSSAVNSNPVIHGEKVVAEEVKKKA